MKIKKIESINVIPFIDIMLVLLAIVLTTATFIVKGSIQVDLPKAAASAKTVQKPIELTIHTDGTVYLGDKLVSKKNLLSELQTASKESTIIINGDRGMEYQYFVTIIDTLTAGGYTHISIASLQHK